MARAPRRKSPRRRRRSSGGTPAELSLYLVAAGLPKPEAEYRFAKDAKPPRQWRFDLAWPDLRFAVEVDGGSWMRRPCPSCGVPVPMGGGHSTGAQAARDREKHQEAICLGWTVLRVVPEEIPNGRALGLIERAFRARRLLP